jgi:hypothetical protein
MAAESDTTYFRKYLNDPDPVNDPAPTQIQDSSSQLSVETPDTTYFRKYLNDPNA